MTVVALLFAACDDDDANGGNPQATGADAGNQTRPAGADLPGIDEIDPAAPAAGIPPISGDAQVVTTDSGLRYIDIEVGTGAAIENGQTATVNYTGWLTNGTQFDSSLNPGRTPFQFPVGAQRVIAGWDEGVGSMNVGGKRRLIIPAELGYGDRGSGSGSIPPGAVLIFDVEVLSAQ
jgi:hypothetical protein